MQNLQDQLGLLALKTQKNYDDLHVTSRALNKPLLSLQNSISV